MTTAKLDSKMAVAAALALEPYIQPLYNTPGRRVVGVIELAHIERTEPAPAFDREPSVKVRMTALELANAEQEHTLREVMRALWLHRTAAGTLTEDGEVELTGETLALAGGQLHAIEAARLRAVLAHWVRYIAEVQARPRLSAIDMRQELHTVADGLRVALNGTTDAE